MDELVWTLRGWADEAGMSVRQVHEGLRPDHFPCGKVPALKRLRTQLGGQGLTWALVEAVADVCFPEESAARTGQRLEPAQDLWRRAGERRVAPAPPVTADGMMRLYAALTRTQQALLVSEQRRVQALQIGTLLFAYLGQAQASVAELTRQQDRSRAAGGVREGADDWRARLAQARELERELRVDLDRAEAQRAHAQEVADRAVRRMRELEAQLRVRGGGLPGDGTRGRPDGMPGSAPPALPPEPSVRADGSRADGSRADATDALLRGARDALGQGREALEEAAHDVGWIQHPEGTTVIPGQVVPVAERDGEPPSGGDRAGEHSPAEAARAREVAATLQRVLLPQAPEQPAELLVDGAYLPPAAAGGPIGGCWYDVVPLGAGRTALVAGDVQGSGARAASLMGQLSTAIRGFARLDLPPHEVLRLLDGLITEIDRGRTASCLYAVHDPESESLVHARAGHLPLLVRDRSGTVVRAEGAAGPLLGSGGGQACASVSLEFAPGSLALLYSRGLVARRGRDLGNGVAALEDVFAEASGPPSEITAGLLDRMGARTDAEEDLVVLLAGHPLRSGLEAELFRSAGIDFPGDRPQEIRRVRAFAREVLAAWGLPEGLCYDAVLAVCELVTNAAFHRFGSPARSVRLHLRRTPHRLVIAVRDGTEAPPVHHVPTLDARWGRGVHVVASLSSDWGSRRRPGDGKTVWCEFALD
ncbi:SpoIIE family protein phosphatase [Streptomyces sp. NPDC059752]|uniref:ATP-binding SpoIIE family protein phosphatase n=1 Tax=unclassified Streptomyces TaxID=2593676 RepID=UPI0036519B11